jgi:3D-(3,5/4)-trihydroxycyclohexane-1,2-dione acylhydrolase (decyclizing)
LCDAKKQTRTSVVVVETAYDHRVPGYESWWDVPIAEVSEREG